MVRWENDDEEHCTNCNHSSGSIMLCGCFAIWKASALYKVNRFWTKPQIRWMVISWTKFVFQQVNDPKHASKLAVEWIRQTNIKSWSQSHSKYLAQKVRYVPHRFNWTQQSRVVEYLTEFRQKFVDSYQKGHVHSCTFMSM